jgi:hypothetical protein
MADASAWFDVQTMSDCPSSDPAASKTELHRVLNSFQNSQDFGMYVCEAFRDPRQHYIDDYWAEIESEAVGIHDLRKCIGKTTAPLEDDARRKLYQFSRLLERLSKRIDRVVTGPS